MATRGFWLDVLCVMHEMSESTLTASHEELARLVGCESMDVAKYVLELKRTKTADVIIGNGDVTLVSRRFARELSSKEGNRLRVQKHRGNGDVTPMSQNKVISNNKKKEIREETTEAVVKKRTTTTDDAWLLSLQENPAYKKLDVANEFEKAKVWVDANNRQLTRRFFVGWINRAKPMQINETGAQNGRLSDRAQRAIDDHNTIERVRQSVEERRRGLSERDATDRKLLT